MKNIRHFLCGLLLGAAGVYWYAFYSADFFAAVLAWLQQEADAYRASHLSLEGDAGWRPKK
jgi:hypothetical protein